MIRSSLIFIDNVGNLFISLLDENLYSSKKKLCYKYVVVQRIKEGQLKIFSFDKILIQWYFFTRFFFQLFFILSIFLFLLLIDILAFHFVNNKHDLFKKVFKTSHKPVSQFFPFTIKFQLFHNNFQIMVILDEDINKARPATQRIENRIFT